MKLIVGAPVRDRAWILPYWFEHLRATVEHAVHISECEVVLVGSQHDPSRHCALKLAHGYGVDLYWHEPESDHAGPYRREWSMERYEMMAALRNELLAQVRTREPDLFWSLDTDILAAENTLLSAMQHLEDFDAIGTKLYMTPQGRYAPSYGMLPPGGGLRRDDAECVLKVDMIMASKLMTPRAYAVDYVAHRQGEDAGWSIAARDAGCKLRWDGTTTSKHVMRRQDLSKVDSRCGF